MSGRTSQRSWLSSSYTVNSPEDACSSPRNPGHTYDVISELREALQRPPAADAESHERRQHPSATDAAFAALLDGTMGVFP
jgi:hypothetical protein